MLHTDTVKLLQCLQQIKPEDVPILLTATTGVAAHNINGITVHSAFMLNDRKKAGTTYYNLGSDTLSTLQTHLEQLMVVIIDEISMIGAQTLYQNTHAPARDKRTTLLKYTVGECNYYSSWRSLPTSPT